MAGRRRNEKSGARKNRRGDSSARKRFRHLNISEHIDLRDYDCLRQFMTEHGKIVPSRITGVTAKQQRQVKRGIRRAREIGLMP